MRSFRPALLAVAISFFALPAAQAQERIPVEFVDGMPVITVQLGRLHADFLLDSGARTALFVPAPLVVPAAGIQAGEAQQKSTDAAGHIATTRTLVAERVRIGETDLGRLDGVVNYQWGLSVGGDAPDVFRKGKLGLDAFKAWNVLFDLAHGELRLYPRGGTARPDLASWASAPFVLDGRGIVIDVRAGSGKATLVLDSGASQSFLRQDAALWRSGRPVCAHGERDCDLRRWPEVRAGDIALGDLALRGVEMGPVPFDGLIGMDFLRRHQVFVDFDAGVVHARPVAG
jgi:hypothetical protein